MSRQVWERIDHLVDRSPSLDDLAAHGLHLLAAERWRAQGHVVPNGLVREELLAEYAVRSLPQLVEEVRDATTGPLVVFKGPTLAALYERPTLRPFSDLDVLVRDPAVTQAALVASDFVPTDDPAAYEHVSHQLVPLRSPRHPVAVEVHRHPKWPSPLRRPSFDELLRHSQPADLEVEEVLTLTPSAHALVLAAHLWAHDPLTRLLRIVDLALLAEVSDPRETELLARRWGMSKLWRATLSVLDDTFGEATPPLSRRIWARGLSDARESTVLELHVGRLVAPFSVFPFHQALSVVGHSLWGFARPHEGETWGRKIRRTARQLVRPSMRRSRHVAELGERPPRGPN